jgi:hypothetical protein
MSSGCVFPDSALAGNWALERDKIRINLDVVDGMFLE